MCHDFYSTKSICILCSWKAKIVPLVWAGLAHRNRKSATSFSHSHAEVLTGLILLRSPSPSYNYHISYAGWSLKAWLITWWNTENYGMLYCVMCHWNYFLFPMLQLPIQFCLSFLFIFPLLCRKSLPEFWLQYRIDAILLPLFVVRYI